MVEMTAVEFLKEYERMCKMHDLNCSECPMSELRRKYNENICGIIMIVHPEETIDIVQKFAEERPPKTILMDFLEKYPNAFLESDGTPVFCPESLGYKHDHEICDSLDDDSCKKCWNRPLEE